MFTHYYYYYYLEFARHEDVIPEILKSLVNATCYY
jgi:hypothetical protein